MIRFGTNIVKKILRKLQKFRHISKVERSHFLASYLLGALTAPYLKRIYFVSRILDRRSALRLARSLALVQIPDLHTWQDDLFFAERYERSAAADRLGDLDDTTVRESSLSPRQLLQLSHVYSSSGELEKAARAVEACRKLQYERSGLVIPKDVALLGRSWTGALGHLLSIEHVRRLSELGVLPYRSLTILCQKFPIANRVFLLQLAKIFPEITLIQPYDSEQLNKRTEQFELDSLLIRDESGRKCDLVRCRDIASWMNRQSDFPAKRLISEKIKSLGNEALGEMGISEDDQVVCVHVRSGTHGPGRGLANSDVLTYLSAIKYLLKTGRKVVRMGDPSMPKLPELRGLIDLAHSERKAPWLDLYLWSRADFAIGTNSGGSEGFCLFGVPTIHTNTTCVSSFPYGFRSFICPKLFKRSRAKEPMPLEEFLRTPFGWSDSLRHPGFDDVEVVDNSPDDIMEAVKEMDSFLASQKLDLPSSPSDVVLKGIRNILGRDERSTISRSFLARHPYLLD